jgi:membrane protein implicated in regulation of membrane protease activity
MVPPTVALQFDLVGPETLPLLLVVAGLGLSVAEALIPGAHFVVPGVAMLLAGLVGLAVPFLAGPIALGALVLLFGAVALYGYREVDLYGGEGGRTSDSDSLRGATGRVTERVTPTEGEVRIEGGGFNPNYAARSVDGEFPEGTEVIVVDPGGGSVLTVEALDPVEDEIDRQLRRGREADDGGRSSVTDADRETERERGP